MSLQVMEVMEKFLEAVAAGKVVTDYTKLDCITTIFTGFLSRSQPLPFWKAFIPVFSKLFGTHGAILMGRENDRFLKQVVFHLLRLAVFRNDSIRKRAVVGLQLLVRVCFQLSSLIRLPHVHSNMSMTAKLGVINSQFYRFLRLCSCKKFFVFQMVSIIVFLNVKGYPLKVLLKRTRGLVLKEKFLFGISAFGIFRMILLQVL